MSVHFSICVCTHMFTHAHSYSQKHKHTHTHKRAHTHTHTSAHTHTHALSLSLSLSLTHTHTHTHTHTFVFRTCSNQATKQKSERGHYSTVFVPLRRWTSNTYARSIFDMDTKWRRCIEYRIFMGHFPRKSPIISDFFAERILQFKDPVHLRPPVHVHEIFGYMDNNILY